MAYHLCELLTFLRIHAIGVLVQGEQLALDCPRGVITDDVRQAIRQHKAVLVALFEPFPPPSVPWEVI